MRAISDFSSPRNWSGWLTALRAALAVCFVCSVLLVARDLVTERTARLSSGQRPAGASAPMPRMKQAGDYARVVEHNAFGMADERFRLISAGHAGSSSEPSAPVLTGLTVHGVMTWPGGRGFAVITTPSATQEVYRVGDDIPGAGVLTKVEAGGIVVRSSGVTARVALAEPETGGVSVASAAEERAPRAVEVTALARRTGDDEYAVSRAAVEAAVANPRQLLSDARLMPYVRDNVQEGFVLSEVNPSGLYSQLGLNNGDVLVGVNRLKLTNPEAALQAFTALRGMNRVELEVLRGGARKVISYRIQ